MNVFITIILICEAQAYYDQRPDTPNVGTVLFTQSDLYNKRWSTDKIKILQARKYLQDLLPSPYITKFVNEDYLTNLLTYFKESYRTVKREAKDSEINNAMNIALSDALGGFLKVWVLPITKYAFYGGTVSMEQAIDTFQVYNDIKRNLNTDGRGWRSPNEDLLKSVAIDVISRPRSHVPRCMKDPCKQLAYYEKTDTDLIVPLPVINWDILPITIFVPLKNQSIVPISSENSSKILFHYYDIAENCMQSQNPTNVNDFNEKFQKWLSKDVTPHLKDDNLYLAFGSILSLINDTKKIPGTLSYACHNNFENIKFKAKSFSINMCNSSKKYLILILIVLVEVMWCLPSLFYIIRLRRRKRDGENTQGFIFGFFKRKPKESINTISHSKQNKIFKYNYFSDSDHTEDPGVKISVKPRVKQLKVDAQCPSFGSNYMSVKSSKSNKRNSINDQVNIVNEVPLKSSLKKILPEFNTSFVAHDSTKRSTIDKNDNAKDTNLQSLNQVSTKAMTLIQDEKTIKEINYSQESSLEKANNDQPQEQCVCPSKDDKNHKSFNLCPCTSCLKDDKQCTEVKDKKLHNNLRSKFEKIKKSTKKQHKTVMKTEFYENLQIKQNVDRNTYRATAENSKANFDKPLLRIRIDKPKTEIRVGISSFKEHSRRPSKIPRLAKKDAYNRNDEKNDNLSEKTEKLFVNNLILRKKNLRKTIDDTAIKRTTKIDKKLNITL